eukprot:COSAG01_NODE_3200_length_6428_cov_43.886870_4_plen_51_part_00
MRVCSPSPATPQISLGEAKGGTSEESVAIMRNNIGKRKPGRGEQTVAPLN